MSAPPNLSLRLLVPSPCQPHHIGVSDYWCPPHVNPTPLVPLITGPLPCQPHSIGPSSYWSPPHVSLHSHQPLPLVIFHCQCPSPLPTSPSLQSPVPFPCQAPASVTSITQLPLVDYSHCPVSSPALFWCCLHFQASFQSSPLSHCLSELTYPAIPKQKEKKSYPFACSGLRLCTPTYRGDCKSETFMTYNIFTRALHHDMKLGSAWLTCLCFSVLFFSVLNLFLALFHF